MDFLYGRLLNKLKIVSLGKGLAEQIKDLKESPSVW